MNNFGFYVLGNYSPNICTFGKHKSTCYRLLGFSKDIFLDFGAGVFLKFLRVVKKENIDIICFIKIKKEYKYIFLGKVFCIPL